MRDDGGEVDMELFESALRCDARVNKASTILIETRATTEMHHYFSEVSSLWELKTSLSPEKLIWREKQTAYIPGDEKKEKKHGLGTQREDHAKKKNPRFPTFVGFKELRHSETFLAKKRYTLICLSQHASRVIRFCISTHQIRGACFGQGYPRWGGGYTVTFATQFRTLAGEALCLIEKRTC